MSTYLIRASPERVAKWLHVQGWHEIPASGNRRRFVRRDTCPGFPTVENVNLEVVSRLAIERADNDSHLAIDVRPAGVLRLVPIGAIIGGLWTTLRFVAALSALLAPHGYRLREASGFGYAVAAILLLWGWLQLTARFREIESRIHGLLSKEFFVSVYERDEQLGLPPVVGVLGLEAITLVLIAGVAILGLKLAVLLGIATNAAWFTSALAAALLSRCRYLRWKTLLASAMMQWTALLYPVLTFFCLAYYFNIVAASYVQVALGTSTTELVAGTGQWWLIPHVDVSALGRVAMSDVQAADLLIGLVLAKGALAALALSLVVFAIHVFGRILRGPRQWTEYVDRDLTVLHRLPAEISSPSERELRLANRLLTLQFVAALPETWLGAYVCGNLVLQAAGSVSLGGPVADIWKFVTFSWPSALVETGGIDRVNDVTNVLLSTCVVLMCVPVLVVLAARFAVPFVHSLRIKRLHVAPPDVTDFCSELAAGAGVGHVQLVVQQGTALDVSSYAPVFGRPQIIVTTGALAGLDPAALRAGVAHEIGHLVNDWPRLQRLRALSSASLAAPNFLALTVDFADAELLADRFAIEHGADREAMRRVILAMFRTHAVRLWRRAVRSARWWDRVRADAGLAVLFYFGTDLIGRIYPAFKERLRALDKLPGTG